jgi:hypothetical protein
MSVATLSESLTYTRDLNPRKHEIIEALRYGENLGFRHLQTSNELFNLKKELIEWQPIDTAPKDGTKILTCGPKSGRYVSVWNKNGMNWAEAGGEEYWTYNDPTHWMPLPDKPIMQSPDVQQQTKIKD